MFWLIINNLFKSYSQNKTIADSSVINISKDTLTVPRYAAYVSVGQKLSLLWGGKVRFNKHFVAEASVGTLLPLTWVFIATRSASLGINWNKSYNSHLFFSAVFNYYYNSYVSNAPTFQFMPSIGYQTKPIKSGRCYWMRIGPSFIIGKSDYRSYGSRIVKLSPLPVIEIGMENRFGKYKTKN